MARKGGGKSWVMVKRAAVVAKVLGFEHDEVLTLGRAVAGLNAYSKGVSLRLFQPRLRTARFKQLSKSCGGDVGSEAT